MDDLLNRDAKHFVDPETRFKLILSVYLVLMNDNEVLLLRRANTGYEDGKYGLPSGHAEGGESGTAATTREMLEETGITVQPDDLSWFALDNLPDNTIPYIKQALELSQKQIFYSEFGWEGNE